MRRPQDPRNHGLKEPKEVLSRKESLTLTNSGELSLETIIGAWGRVVKDHLSQGHRITDGPSLKGDYYGNSLILVYEYSWDNLNFSVEKAEWDIAIADYEGRLEAWQKFEEERKNTLGSQTTKNIDALILRAQHRLANLIATKEGRPIPYPEG